MRVITNRSTDDPSGYCRRAKIQYWSNSAGDLYNPKNAADSHELDSWDLPKPLRYVYERLWAENAGGANCYLVETPEVGYGIALIYEYWKTKDSKLTQEETFEALLKDAEKLAAHDALWSATIYALEDMKDMGPVLDGEEICNELAIVFPAGIPVADFNIAKIACEEMSYTALKESTCSQGKVVLFLHDGVLSGGFTSDPDIRVVVSVFETDLDSKEGEDAFWTKCKEEGLRQFEPEIVHYEDNNEEGD